MWFCRFLYINKGNVHEASSGYPWEYSFLWVYFSPFPPRRGDFDRPTWLLSQDRFDKANRRGHQLFSPSLYFSSSWGQGSTFGSTFSNWHFRGNESLRSTPKQSKDLEQLKTKQGWFSELFSWALLFCLLYLFDEAPSLELAPTSNKRPS